MKQVPANNPQTLANVSRFLDWREVLGVDPQPWPFPDDWDRSRIWAIDTLGMLWAACNAACEGPERFWDRDPVLNHGRNGMVPVGNFRSRTSPSMQANFYNRVERVEDGRVLYFDSKEVEIDFDYWSPLMGPGSWVKHAGEFLWNGISRSQTDPARVARGLAKLIPA